MSEIKDLLELALGDGHGPHPGTPVDPTDDLIRGRALIRRRRMGVGATAATVTALLVAAGFVPTLLAGNAAGTQGHARPPTIGAGPGANGTTAVPGLTSTSGTTPPAPGTTTATPAVALVAYHGEQIPGYRVAEVPAGWVIQGGNASVLTIAPKGFPDQHVDSFEGKLVVMLDSVDAQPLKTAEPGATYQPVAGQPGVYRVEPAWVDRPGAMPTTGTCEVLLPGGADAKRQLATAGSLSPQERRRQAGAFQRKYVTRVPCASLPRPSDIPRPAVTHVAMAVLTYRLGDGRQMVIQAPASLGWDGARLARFAEGVQVLPNAQGGVG